MRNFKAVHNYCRAHLRTALAECVPVPRPDRGRGMRYQNNVKQTGYSFKCTKTMVVYCVAIRFH